MLVKDKAPYVKKKRKYQYLKAADENDRIRNSSKIYYSSEI